MSPFLQYLDLILPPFSPGGGFAIRIKCLNKDDTHRTISRYTRSIGLLQVLGSLGRANPSWK